MSGKGKILLVDGDPATRESLQRFFQRERYRPRGCPGGTEAAEAMERERWDLALVDVGVAGRGGVELLGRMRSLQPDLPVLMMTAQPSVETAVATLKAGARDYLIKPLDLDGLSLAIARLLAQNRAGAVDAGESLREVERRHIQKVVEHTGGNLSRAARILGIDRSTLYSKLHKYGLR